MLEILLAPLLTLTPPQDPAAATAPSTTVAAETPHRWLPATTLAALTVAPVREGTDLARLLQTPAGRQLTKLLENQLAPLAQRFGTTPQAVLQLAQNGIALGWLGFTGTGEPEFLFVADLGEGASLLEGALLELPAATGAAAGLRRIRTDNGTTAFVRLHGTRIAIGNAPQSVLRALAEPAGEPAPTLATLPELARALPARDHVVALFVRPDHIVAAALTAVAAEYQDAGKAIATALGVEQMRAFGIGYRIDGDQLVTEARLATGRVIGLLDALAGQPGRLDANLARFVPPEATGFGFAAVDVGAVLERAIELATMVEPSSAMMIDSTLGRVQQRTGVDMRRDVLQGFAGRIVTATLPGDGEVPAFAVMLELKNGPAFAKAFGKLLPALPVPLRTGTAAGVQCWRVPASGLDAEPALAVVGTWLVFASSDAELTKLVRQIQQPQQNQAAHALLRSLPEGTTWAGESRGIALPGEQFSALRTQLAQLGPRRSHVARTRTGVQWTDRIAAVDVLRTTSIAAVEVGRLAGMEIELPPLESDAATPVASTTSTPTDPGAASGAETAAGSATDVEPDRATIARLRELEQQTGGEDTVGALRSLLEHESSIVAARAAWLLGRCEDKAAIAPLAATMASHANADVRAQAAQSLCRLAGPDELGPLTDACEDTDRRVRTIALTTIARLAQQHPQKVSRAAVLAPAQHVLDTYGSTASTEAPTDLVAALVLEHDHGGPSHLLPAATAIGFADRRLGEALTFLFQDHSTSLPPGEETATLLAVLDHPEPMLRRYAIQRLGELRNPAAAKALEGRLAVEGPELQPLVRVSLTAVRGDDVVPEDDLVARAKHNVAQITAKARAGWRALDEQQQWMVAGGGGGAIALLMLGVALRRRRRRRLDAAAEAAALLQPSAQYLEDQAAEAGQHDQQYDQQYDYADDTVQYQYVDDGAAPATEYETETEEYEPHGHGR